MSTSCLDPSSQIGTLGKTQLSRVKFILCKYVQFRLPSIHSLRLPSPLFLLSLCPGPAFPKARLSLPCCGPLCPGRRRPCPEEGSPHSPSLLAGCCAGMAGHTLGSTVPASRTCHAARCILTAAASPSLLPKSRPKKNARFSFAGKHRHLAILRDPRPPPPIPDGARFGAENAPGLVKRLFGPLLGGSCVLLQKLAFNELCDTGRVGLARGDQYPHVLGDTLIALLTVCKAPSFPPWPM